MWNDFDTWGRVMDVTLIALAVVDSVAFVLEIRGHGWTRAAKAEAVGLVVLAFLGLGDWHLHTLASRHDEQLQKELDQERESRTELQRKLEGMKDKVIPRHLTRREAEVIASAVRDVGGLPKFEIATLISESEAQVYAAELLVAFKNAGCDVDGPTNDTGISPTNKGLFAVWGSNGSGATRVEAATLVANVLAAAGLRAQVAPRTDVARDRIQLVVGTVP